MAYIWKIKGELAGRFVIVDDDEAERLVKAGEAQYANDSAIKIKPAEYRTREMTAEKIEPEKIEPEKVKRKRRTKAEMEAAKESDNEPETDGD